MCVCVCERECLFESNGRKRISPGSVLAAFDGSGVVLKEGERNVECVNLP